MGRRAFNLIEVHFRLDSFITFILPLVVSPFILANLEVKRARSRACRPPIDGQGNPPLWTLNRSQPRVPVEKGDTSAGGNSSPLGSSKLRMFWWIFRRAGGVRVGMNPLYLPAELRIRLGIFLSHGSPCGWATRLLQSLPIV